MGPHCILTLILILLLSFSAMAHSYHCAFCGKSPPTLQGLNSHLLQKASCRIAMQEQLARKTQLGNVNAEDVATTDEWEGETDMIIDYKPPSPIGNPSTLDSGQAPPETMAPPVDRRARVNDIDEDKDDKECERWIEDFLKPAGVPIQPAKSYFEKVWDNQKQRGEEPWAPFHNMEEWELGQFLLLNLGQNVTDKFLKLPIVSKVYSILNHSLNANEALRHIIEPSRHSTSV